MLAKASEAAVTQVTQVNVRMSNYTHYVMFFETVALLKLF